MTAERKRLITEPLLLQRLNNNPGALPSPTIRFTYDDLQQSTNHRQLFASPIESNVTNIAHQFTPVVPRPHIRAAAAAAAAATASTPRNKATPMPSSIVTHERKLTPNAASSRMTTMDHSDAFDDVFDVPPHNATPLSSLATSAVGRGRAQPNMPPAAAASSSMATNQGRIGFGAARGSVPSSSMNTNGAFGANNNNRSVIDVSNDGSDHDDDDNDWPRNRRSRPAGGNNRRSFDDSRAPANARAASSMSNNNNSNNTPIQSSFMSGADKLVIDEKRRRPQQGGGGGGGRHQPSNVSSSMSSGGSGGGTLSAGARSLGLKRKFVPPYKTNEVEASNAPSFVKYLHLLHTIRCLCWLQCMNDRDL
jgi:hypothetical protein